MKAQQIMMLPLVIAVLIAVSGAQCSSPFGGKGQGDEDRNTLSSERFRTGSEGVEMKWADDMPKEIFDTDGGTEEILLIAEVRNRGAETITSGNLKFHLGGFDQTHIGLPYKPFFSEDLEGKSLRNEEGGFTILEIPSGQDTCGTGTFGCGVVNLPEGIDIYNPRFQLTAC